jgi:hypothetical protein
MTDLVISPGSLAESSKGRTQQICLKEDLVRQLSAGVFRSQRLRLNLFSGENPMSALGLVTEHSTIRQRSYHPLSRRKCLGSE